MPRRLVIAVTALVCLLALAAVLTASTQPGAPSPRSVRGKITIATGGITGVYDLYGSQYARLLRTELPGLSVTTVTTAGSVDNLERLADGRAQVGFATADTAFHAMATASASASASTGPATTSTGGSLRAVARVYDEYIHVVVRSDSRARTLKDLRHLRVSTGSAGSSTELVADRLLGAVGLSAQRDLVRHRLGINDSVALMRAGGLDAFFWSGGLPTPGIETLSKTQQIRLLPLGDHVHALRAQHGAFYRRAIVPAATYGLAETVTVGVPNYLVVSSTVDENVVYQLTRVLFERRKDLAKDVPSGRLLDARTAISTIPIPLHPGAARYYREHKP